ncbi:MAG: hypothetical protein IJ856_06295 [Candidatus Methanomethylophilaceae archaeon]|nr:hypothetical protein [Candidatus Methanomethylophilaceae archaeon]
MSSIVYLRNPKSNTIYAYLNEPVWDPEKRKNVYKRRCIGHVDPNTGEIVPNRASRVKEFPTVRSEYLCKVLDKVSEDIHLSECLRMTFPDFWKKVASIIYYLVCTDDDLAYCQQWSVRHSTPYNQVLTPKLISEVLSTINSNSISLFFTLWRLRLQPAETYVTRVGFGGSGSSLNQYSKNINLPLDDLNDGYLLEMFVSTKNNIPICYRLFDRATDRRLGDYDVNPDSFTKLSSFMDETKGDSVDPTLIAYANTNITVRIRPENEFVRPLLDKVEPTMTDPENYRLVLGTPVFTQSFMQHLNGHRYYIHFFFNPTMAAENLSTFISVINLCKNEVMMEQTNSNHVELYSKYLIIGENEDGTSVELNSEAIMHHNKYLGYTVLVSNHTRLPSSALVPFLHNELLSRAFDSLRNDTDGTGLNLYAGTNFLSRVFLQFLSLILRMELEYIMDSKKLNRTYPFKTVMLELSNILTVRTPGVKKAQNTFMTDDQIRILNAFGVQYEE